MNDSQRGILYVFIGIFTWATVELTAKLLQGAISPIGINFFRLALGGIVLILYIVASKRTGSFVFFTKNYIKYYLPATVLGLVLGLLIFFYGVNLTQASIAATIFSANPIIVSLFMMFYRGEKRTPKKIGGILLGFIGVWIVAVGFNFTGILNSQYLLGNILVLFGMVLWSVHVIIGKIVLSLKKEPLPDGTQPPSVTSMDFNAITFLLGAIVSLPTLFLRNDWNAIPSYTIKTWLILLYLGAITGGIGYVAFFRGLQLIEASKGINAFYFKPIIATILAFFILAEIPSWNLFVGIGIEIGAMILISKN